MGWVGWLVDCVEDFELLRGDDGSILLLHRDQDI